MITISLASAAVATFLGPSAAVSPSAAERLQQAAMIVHEIRTEIPDEYWDRARCVVVVPDLKKAAFIVGGEYGKGVMSCRAGDGWSAPVFMQLARGSWGFQAGVEEVDLVLLVMNERGVQKLLNNKTTLGADASAAAGPVGRRAAAATDAQITAEIVSYSRSRGLFAGIDLSGGVLRPDGDVNVAAYGPGAEPRTILASRAISAPVEAQAFLQSLGPAAAADASPAASAAPQTTTPAASTPPTPRTTTMSTTDDDLRARVVDIEQALDRILAETTPGPVGTSGAAPTTAGTTPEATVTVDRAKLLQLRHQLDQLLAALNRR